MTKSFRNTRNFRSWKHARSYFLWCHQNVGLANDYGNSEWVALCWGNPPVTAGSPSQKASNAESVSMPLRHHERECGVHDDVIKWKHFPRYWPSVRGFRRSSVNSPAQRPVMFFFICAWINDWVNNREAGWDAIVSIVTSLSCTHEFARQRYISSCCDFLGN